MGHEIGLASEMRLRRMEHKLKSLKMVSFLETLVFQLQNVNSGIKKVTALITRQIV
jgi:tRNA uridine 5-carboxymethylaminomethyl modification enzyme